MARSTVDRPSVAWWPRTISWQFTASGRVEAGRVRGGPDLERCRSGIGVRRAISGAKSGSAVGVASGACPVPEAISVTMESLSSSS